MLSSTSNLSINEQQATAAKRKENGATAVTQATAATAYREHEAFVAAIAIARKTLDEAPACERAAALAW
jgi:hypothetical protein